MSALKCLAAFAAGIGCGAAVTKFLLDEKHRKILDEELQAIENFATENIKKDEKEAFKQPEIVKTSIDDYKTRSTELKNYNKMAETYISSVPPSDNFIEERIGDMHDKMEKLAESEHPREESGEQYEITPMDWLDDGIYDKVILTYYTGDDTVANEAGLIDDIGMSIGMEQFEIFRSSDELERYVRNPALGIDYNIVKEPGCYHV